MIRKKPELETIDQSEENQVLGQTATQSAERDAQVVTAAVATQAIETNQDSEALPPAIAGAGRSHFVPNTNLDRMVTVLTPVSDNNQLFVKRVASSSDEGGTVDQKYTQDVFGEATKELQHKQQVTIALVNGMLLVGYVTKTKTRNGIYLPKKYLPANFPLPKQGTLQPVLVAKLIVG